MLLENMARLFLVSQILSSFSASFSGPWKVPIFAGGGGEERGRQRQIQTDKEGEGDAHRHTQTYRSPARKVFLLLFLLLCFWWFCCAAFTHAVTHVLYRLRSNSEGRISTPTPAPFTSLPQAVSISSQFFPCLASMASLTGRGTICSSCQCVPNMYWQPWLALPCSLLCPLKITPEEEVTLKSQRRSRMSLAVNSGMKGFCQCAGIQATPSWGS